MHTISILDTEHYSHAKGYKLKLYVHVMKAYEITFVLVQKVILCIEELTRQEAMKSTFSVSPCCQCVKSVTNSQFVSHDLFICWLNRMSVTSKMQLEKVDRNWYGQVMAVFLLACKEMVTRIEKLLIWMFPLHFEFHQLLSPIVLFHQEFNGE